MRNTASSLYKLRQNDRLPIRIVSPEFGHLSAQEASGYEVPHHTPYYLFLFLLDGHSRHHIDLQAYELGRDELIFVMPHQVHDRPAMEPGTNFIKLGFDESCLSLLPRQYPFLIDPLHDQQLRFEPDAGIRIKAIFAILLDLLRHWHTDPELILAHLNSLLTEINTAYFRTQQKLAGDDRHARFVAFKTFMEHNLTRHLSLGEIAGQLGVNTNGLYQIVKRYSGLSPRAFINKRLILEARRRICYEGGISVKELAYELGFNDPEYFSRLFKNVTGQTVARFAKDLSGK